MCQEQLIDWHNLPISDSAPPPTHTQALVMGGEQIAVPIALPIQLPIAGQSEAEIISKHVKSLPYTMDF